MDEPQLDHHVSVGALVAETTPAVSIIIPNYNTAQYIAETIDSVLAQTFADYEIIVVNDAAPDTPQLKTALEPYIENLTFIDSYVNKGTSSARNLGSHYARGEILSFLDADDIWKPDFLDEMLEFLESNDFAMVYSCAETFGYNEFAPKDYLKNNPEGGDITRWHLVNGKCLILPSGTLLQKKEFVSVGGFDPKISRTEDFDLWMRLAFAGARIGYLQKTLFRFRLRPGSGSGDSIQRLERCSDMWRTLQNKLAFTEDENRVIERHIACEDAAVLRAKGRLNIHQKNWKAAKEDFREANSRAKDLGLPWKHRAKLFAIILMLNIWPELLLRLFKYFRSGEVEYMPGVVIP